MANKIQRINIQHKTNGIQTHRTIPRTSSKLGLMMEKIQKSKRKEIKVLNLFAYTGGATVACLAAGASVCHVDSSKGMTTWAKENVVSSGLEKKTS